MRVVLMRCYATMLWVLLASLPGHAQQYPAFDDYRGVAPSATAQAPQPAAPQQISENNYPTQPLTAHASTPAAVAAPTTAAPAPAQPWDYGRSVTTDIRQMNF